MDLMESRFPGYSSMSRDQQDTIKAGLALGNKHKDLLHSLSRRLFGADIHGQEHRMSEQQRRQMNIAKQFCLGVGDNYLCMSEGLSAGKTLIDYPTVFDFKHEDFLMHKKIFQMDYDFDAYLNQRISSDLATLLINEELYNAHLTTLANFIIFELTVHALSVIQDLIPNQYDIAEKTLDILLNANGMETDFGKLHERFYEYLHKTKLSKRINQYKADNFTVMRDVPSDDGAPCMWIIFSGESAMKNVRFKHFYQDALLLSRNTKNLDDILTYEKCLITVYLQHEYQRITRSTTKHKNNDASHNEESCVAA